VRIGCFNPFLDALGGGEKYFLSVMEEAVRRPGAEVTLLAQSEPDVEAWGRLNVAIPRDAFTWTPLSALSEVTERSADLDLLITWANDFPIASRAGRAVAMIQFPFVPWERRGRRALATALGAVGLRRGPAALATYELVVCNSRFTAEHLGRRLGVREPAIIAPPVDEPASVPAVERRRPIVLGVGRFFRGFHNKKHDVLIDAFRALASRRGVGEGWELHLVGGAADHPEVHAYVEELRARAEGLPVAFHVNADAATLGRLLGEASLFWHATGFGEDGARHPERLEHFGIATAEAMMHGVVPVVVALGAQPEIVEDGVTGRLWSTVDELVDRSAELIADPPRRAALATAAREVAPRRFGRERFGVQVRERVLGPAGRG
jgi:glycosyltransferase involved in cell wall biosynthesis